MVRGRLYSSPSLTRIWERWVVEVIILEKMGQHLMLVILSGCQKVLLSDLPAGRGCS